MTETQKPASSGDPATMATLKRLVDRLFEITKDWNAHDLVSDDEIAECKKIGTELNIMGGLELMQDAYYHAKALNRCVTPLQAYWDQIGDWRY